MTELADSQVSCPSGRSAELVRQAAESIILRVAYFEEPRLPEHIPIAGVTLLELLGEQATYEE